MSFLFSENVFNVGFVSICRRCHQQILWSELLSDVVTRETDLAGNVSLYTVPLFPSLGRASIHERQKIGCLDYVFLRLLKLPGEQFSLLLEQNY